jgi:hypothetical protein
LLLEEILIGTNKFLLKPALSPSLSACLQSKTVVKMVSRREEVYSTLLRGILWPTPLGPLENLSEGLSFAVPASSCVERDGWRTLASIYAEVCSMLCLHPFFLWVEKTVETQMMLWNCRASIKHAEGWKSTNGDMDVQFKVLSCRSVGRRDHSNIVSEVVR